MASNDFVSDIRFFRLTGVALIAATLIAGAMMLFLAAGESRAIYLAQQEASNKEPIQLATVTPPAE